MDDRRERFGWYWYDVANSAFSTTVITVFLGPYLTAVTRAAADAGGFVHPFGVPVHAGAFFPYVVSVSVALQALLLPVLGAVADYSRRKKQMLGVCAYLGAAATTALYLVRPPDYLLGGLLCIVANVSFGASVVFYNAFLPEIARPEERDAVSSRGWALGYLGGGVLLAANLALVMRAPALGLADDEAARLALASAGVWWGLFTLIPLATLTFSIYSAFGGFSQTQVRSTAARARRGTRPLTAIATTAVCPGGRPGPGSPWPEESGRTCPRRGDPHTMRC